MPEVIRTYRYRAYPNAEQRENLARTFGCARWVYNWGLERRTNAYYGEGKSLTYNSLAVELTQVKKREETKWLQEVSSVVLQQSLRNLERAFTNFFEQRAGYPRFKRKSANQSATYANSAFRFDPETMTLTLAKQKTPLKIRWSQKPEGEVVKVTVTLDSSGRYHVCLHCRCCVEPMPKTGKRIGVDLGLNDVVVTSDGFRSGNPKHLRKAYYRLRRAQKALSRKQKGSNNYGKARRRLAKIHARIADQRNDFIHKLTTDLVKNHDVIAVESLAVKNMMNNHCLARSISEASWGEIVRGLEYKCAWYGRTLIKVDRWFPSSKRCSDCGHIKETIPLNVHRWTCEACGVEHDRDVNAAKNILAVGATVAACGDLSKTSVAIELQGIGL
ncbi:transposase [Rhodocaloribacter litoris]|uniref:RNA-guided endonuclease TnpB family protein n=1 Tax=Rhodocaloribacter litoris TaxID=2558931 RepID=UPI001422F75D|nr:RNA-guided endonuclease TnpB family protein [Rhodocaloribacter litoris]QXD15937.1 transposase [Rhodocaloribacter litoris]